MDERYRSIAALAAEQQSVISAHQLVAAGVNSSLAVKWQRRGIIERLGPKSFAIAGSVDTWERRLTAAWFDLEGQGFVDGRSAAQLMHLDGFVGDDIELLVPRSLRHRSPSGRLRSTSRPIPSSDLQWIGGLRVVRAERLIIDAPLFQFTRHEIENAIDSAIRLRLVVEQRLRTRVIAEHCASLNGSRVLLDALVDSGGESRLERMFLRLCREAGLPRPSTQKTYRADGRTIARVDAEFPGGLVVEVAGHGTHATRQQRARDAERQVELTVRGKRWMAFTYEQVRDRPVWIVSQLRQALQRAA